LQCRFEFDADEVRWIIDPANAGACIGYGEPSFTDDGQHHITTGKRISKVAHEVFGRWNAIGVFEHLLAAESLAKPIGLTFSIALNAAPARSGVGVVV